MIYSQEGRNPIILAILKPTRKNKTNQKPHLLLVNSTVFSQYCFSWEWCSGNHAESVGSATGVLAGERLT